MSDELIEFILKFSIPFIIICVALFNLTFNYGHDNLWIVLLCSCVTYLIPSPEMKNSIKNLTSLNLPK